MRYVLEGSVRKAGRRVRVTAQLNETATGSHIWAERYDRELADIFDLQDELTEAISAVVNAELAGSERDLARKKSSAAGWNSSAGSRSRWSRRRRRRPCRRPHPAP